MLKRGPVASAWGAAGDLCPYCRERRETVLRDVLSSSEPAPDALLSMMPLAQQDGQAIAKMRLEHFDGTVQVQGSGEGRRARVPHARWQVRAPARPRPLPGVRLRPPAGSRSRQGQPHRSVVRQGPAPCPHPSRCRCRQFRDRAARSARGGDRLARRRAQAPRHAQQHARILEGCHHRRGGAYRHQHRCPRGQAAPGQARSRAACRWSCMRWWRRTRLACCSSTASSLERLPAGRHAFWAVGRTVKIQKVDTASDSRSR